jgi:hypothetical protein
MSIAVFDIELTTTSDHTLPFAATEVDLADHSTLPTTAASGYENKEPLRVRGECSQYPPRSTLY